MFNCCCSCFSCFKCCLPINASAAVVSLEISSVVYGGGCAPCRGHGVGIAQVIAGIVSKLVLFVVNEAELVAGKDCALLSSWFLHEWCGEC